MLFNHVNGEGKRIRTEKGMMLLKNRRPFSSGARMNASQ